MGGAIAISNREEKGQCMAAWRALDENEYEHPNITVSETRFLDALFCKGSHSRCGELRDRVSEHTGYPSFSILLYIYKYIHEISIDITSVGLASARPNSVVGRYRLRKRSL